jgi:hypothetical protein
LILIELLLQHTSTSNMAAAGSDFACNMCSFLSVRHLALLSDMGKVHAIEDDFKDTCGLDGCVKTYTNYNSYRSHVYRIHYSAGDYYHQREDNQTGDDVAMMIFPQSMIMHVLEGEGDVDCHSRHQPMKLHDSNSS